MIKESPSNMCLCVRIVSQEFTCRTALVEDIKNWRRRLIILKAKETETRDNRRYCGKVKRIDACCLQCTLYSYTGGLLLSEHDI